MTARPGDPVHPPVRSVLPPYDQPDDRLDHLMVTDPEAWRHARHLYRLAALCEPLAGLDVTEHEHRVLEHLADEDTPTVAVVAALLHRARRAPSLDQEADR